MVTKTQYRKLCRIQNTTYYSTKDFDTHKNLYYFLCQHGYIRQIHRDEKFQHYFQITEKGNLEIELFRSDKIRWRITTAIAIFAAIGAYREELALIIKAILKLIE